MSRFLAILGLLAACRTTPALPAPQDEVNKEDVPATVKKIVAPLRGKDAYRITFASILKIGTSADLKHDGEILRRAKGLLIVKAKMSGGRTIEGVRVGKDVWQWNEIAEQWSSGADLSDDTMARGLQDPDVVAGIIEAQAAQAKRTSKDVIEIALGPKEIEEILKEYAPAGVDWSTASATLKLEGEKTYSVAATLTKKDGTKITYSGKTEVGTGDVKLDHPLPPEAEKAIKEYKP